MTVPRISQEIQPWWWADTGDIQAIARVKPQDANHQPLAIVEPAAQRPEYKELVFGSAESLGKKRAATARAQTEAFMDKLFCELRQRNFESRAGSRFRREVDGRPELQY